jgi:hypothetical protein
MLREMALMFPIVLPDAVGVMTTTFRPPRT